MKTESLEIPDKRVMDVYHEAEAIPADLSGAVHLTQVLVEQLKQRQVQQADAGLLVLLLEKK